AKDLHHQLIKANGSENKDKLYEEHHLTSTTLPMFDTIKSLMAFLKLRHIPMAIATSCVKSEIMPTFIALGLDVYIEVVIGRDDVEQVKPDPELYLSAVQQLNYMPTQCLAIEDSVNGATAAIAA
ncbi:HAD-IA family hydrolase, partial [Staphylococcus aureus]|uniref:HAD-IA family hydrolase n=1 Tax=Staphylococcus aureus TaxID=1280 RepID=UPI000A4BA997